jgi:hypothetical protein
MNIGSDTKCPECNEEPTPDRKRKIKKIEDKAKRFLKSHNEAPGN